MAPYRLVFPYSPPQIVHSILLGWWCVSSQNPNFKRVFEKCEKCQKCVPISNFLYSSMRCLGKSFECAEIGGSHPGRPNCWHMYVPKEVNKRAWSNYFIMIAIGGFPFRRKIIIMHGQLCPLWLRRIWTIDSRVRVTELMMADVSEYDDCFQVPRRPLDCTGYFFSSFQSGLSVVWWSLLGTTN